MWGTRAIRVASLGLAMLGGMGGNGCCHCFMPNKYWKDPPPKRDESGKLIPERIHGGII